MGRTILSGEGDLHRRADMEERILAALHPETNPAGELLEGKALITREGV